MAFIKPAQTFTRPLESDNVVWPVLSETGSNPTSKKKTSVVLRKSRPQVRTGVSDALLAGPWRTFKLASGTEKLLPYVGEIADMAGQVANCKIDEHQAEMLCKENKLENNCGDLKEALFEERKLRKNLEAELGQAYTRIAELESMVKTSSSLTQDQMTALRTMVAILFPKQNGVLEGFPKQGNQF